MNKKQLSSFIKGFAAVMTVAVLVIVYIVIRNVGNDSVDADKTEPASQTDAYGSVVPSSTLASIEGSFDILFGCGDSTGVSFVFRAVFDLDGKVVTTYAIPTDITLSYSGKSASVNEVYKNGGAAALSSALGGYYGDSFDRYFFCTRDNFVRITRSLGTAPIQVKQDISFIREDIVLSLEAGKHSLYGEDLYNYLTYSASGAGLLENQAEAEASMLEAYINYKNAAKGEALFSDIINRASSNITAYDYAEKKNLVEAVAYSNSVSFASGGIQAVKNGDTP